MAARTTTDVSIQTLARLAGVTSRTLRHYDAIGLLRPALVDGSGMRWYGPQEIRRLQRILLLRELGLALPRITAVLDRETSPVPALEEHLLWLAKERELLDRRTASVRRTLTALHEGKDLMAEEILDGFDHHEHRAEVEERWGSEAWASGDRWWRGMTPEERGRWAADQRRLAEDWSAAAAAGTDPSSPAAQALASRHVAWLGSIPGTPGSPGEPDLGYVRGLGEMYVADERFAANYGGVDGARFVRDSLRVWAGRHEQA
ncbi:TipAS antibiotic-recognition domain-containing protein [Actinotalea sp.]|uniref:MerR family transcriptional regulator n=1 Tax=Actinotalea sp. TaxID=1872145 RepID=UPI003564FB03